MKSQLLKNNVAEYAPSAFDGKNRSGHRPIGDQVLILPDVVEEKTTGGVFIPDNLRTRQGEAAETGILVEVGDGAWTWNTDRTRKFEGVKPRVGERVCFTRYAGTEVPGRDGLKYRIMSDNCINSVYSE